MRIVSSLFLAACLVSCKVPEGDSDCANVVLFADADGDGFGDAEAPGDACGATDGFVDDGTDCDDADPSVFPDAPEQCTDAADKNCDGSPGMSDLDGDGAAACVDCDDTNPAINADATEVCNGLDDDCDGRSDVDAVDAPVWYADADADGHGAIDDSRVQCDAPEGYIDNFDDCDDTDDAVHPGAEEADCTDPVDYNCDGSVGYADRDKDTFPACLDCDDEQADVNSGATEICNDIDDDCDLQTDEAGAGGERTFYADEDGDGYGSADAVDACDSPGAGYVEVSGDCDDGDVLFHPGAAEACDDPFDYNCDGSIAYEDNDKDGFAACEDCDDADADVHPDAVEICNTIDDDCDALIDDPTAADADTWYLDSDGDGYGDPALSEIACYEPTGYVAATGDCDDLDPAYNPGAAESCDDTVDYNCDGSLAYADADEDGFAACNDCADDDAAVSPDGTEVCNAVDDDCDGEVDEASASDANTWYKDSDGDGYGAATITVVSCAQPTGYVADNTDCDDAIRAVHPSGVETCNGIDDNCDGTVDEDAVDAIDFFADGDGDGFGAGTAVAACAAPTGFVPDDTDCDDGLPAVHPGADELCDTIDDDCDGEIDEPDAVDAAEWYADNDADGFGDLADATLSCDMPEGYVDDATDCDDTSDENHPGADEICDAVDNDCDGATDDDATDADTWYADTDGDLFGAPAVSIDACAAPTGYVAAGTDCDDANMLVHPGASETCNSVDDDCDGVTDPSTSTDAATWYADTDADTFGDPASTTRACAVPTGFVSSSADCDDDTAAVNPAAPELCNGVDDDCDGVIDPTSAIDAALWYADTDADAYGDASDALTACDAPSGYVADATDCDDDDDITNPGADEVCDGVDNDCDTLVDNDATDAAMWHLDGDADGHGGAAMVMSCTTPTGYVAASDDCDDSRPTVYTGAPEVCDGLDNDCDGTVDPTTATDADTWYADDDGDGFGDPASSTKACSAPTGYVADSTDCDDAVAGIHPGATEVCNGEDDDCDGIMDPSSSIDAAEWYADTDEDGHGDIDVAVTACDAPTGYIDLDDDCDDGDADTFPGADEVCDGADNDCNAVIDDAAIDALAWYADGDGDAYGSAIVAFSCTAPTDYVGNALDCDDTRGAVNPGATEVCNSLDDDCDGMVDPGTSADAATWYADADADAFGNPLATKKACALPTGYVADKTDCNDAVTAIHPGATETCNGIDDDCDAVVDPATSADAGTWYADADGDLYGDPDATTAACSVPSGYVADSTDCDDTSGANHPGASEKCDSVDNDCDAVIDEADAVDALTWHRDADTDSYGDPSISTKACSKPTGYVADLTDCDDGRTLTHPGASETCNGIDDDCDGGVDPVTSTDALTWYRDADADTYGKLTSTTKACVQPTGYVGDSTDCDDGRDIVYPGAPELCDGLDNDCDGSLDEGAADASIWYADSDADGFGDPDDTEAACAAPPGYIAVADDCDDADFDTNPLADEVCDGADNDCNGEIDDFAIDASLWHEDTDGDLYGDVEVSVEACTAPSGYVSDDTDCDDAAIAVHPGASEVCNGIDDNCDGSVDPSTSADATKYYLDGDADGYGWLSSSVMSCTLPSGYVTSSTDCDDAAFAVNPAATEVCNSIDDNCDGSVDPSTSADATKYHRDLDADTYGDALTSSYACKKPSGYVSDSTDCDDDRTDVHPGALEVCDDVDNDCDGVVDPEGSLGGSTFYEDTDGDDYGSYATVEACDAPTGYADVDGDCDDTVVTTHPFAPEVCDEVDNDCDDSVDEGLTSTYYPDHDSDGYGTYCDGESCSSVEACSAPSGYVDTDTDCNNYDSSVYPGAVEVCDGMDNDCDGSTDEGVTSTFYYDLDGDGHGGMSTVEACSATSGWVASSDDCDDGDAAVYTGATEVCDSVDNDCDTVIDEGVTTVYYLDSDSDGYGLESSSAAACSLPTGYATMKDDCNDGNAAINPAAAEICNSVDDDCDTIVDEGVTTTYYLDGDGDGYGLGTSTKDACAAPTGYSANKDDCDDASKYVAPKATELCDGQRNDCNDTAWTTSKESGKASYVSSGGAWSDVTSSWAGTSTTPVTPSVSAGTTWLCPGTWYANASIGASGVTLAGRDNSISTPVIDGVSKASVITVTSAGAGATLRSLSLTHGASTTGAGVSAAGSVSIEDCTISNNAASSHGGGIYTSSGTMALSKTTLTSNTAGSNGAGLYATGATVTVVDSTITSNTATSSGGGLYINGSSGKLTVTGSTSVAANKATNSGGGVSLNGGTHTLTGTSITGNKATSTSINTGQGGGVYVLGGASVTLSGVTISSNSATARGGGIYQTSSGSNAVTVKDSSTISSNACTTPTTGATAVAEGGGWAINGGSAKLESSTISSNTVTATGGTAMGGGFAFSTGSASATTSFSCSSSSIVSNIAEATTAVRGGGVGIVAPTTTTATFDASTCNMGDASSGENAPTDVWFSDKGTGTGTSYSAYGVGATFTCVQSGTTSGSCTPTSSP